MREILDHGLVHFMHKYQSCCVIFAVFQGGCITSSGCSSIGLLGGYTQLECAPTANGVVLMLRGDWKWTVDWKETIHKVYKLGARDPRLFEVIKYVTEGCHKAVAVKMCLLVV